MYRTVGGAVFLIIVLLHVSFGSIAYGDDELELKSKRDFWGNSLSMLESSRQPCTMRRCRRYQDCCLGFTCTKYQSYESMNTFSQNSFGRCKRMYYNEYFQFR